MATALSPAHSAESRLECPICLSSVTDPRMLPCLHTLCKHCIEGLVSGSEQIFPCPICRHQCQVPEEGVSGFPRNFFLNDLKELLEEMKQLRTNDAQYTAVGRPCDNAKLLREAHWWAVTFCEECAEFYCPSCVAFHKRFGLTSHHKLSPVEDVDPDAVQAAKELTGHALCGEHPDTKLDFYCDTCQLRVCPKCCLLVHKQHQYRELPAVGKEHPEAMADLIRAANAHLDRVREQAAKLQALSTKIRKDTSRARLQVKVAASEMRNLVNKREKFLLKQIEEAERKALAEVKLAKEDTALQEESAETLVSYMETPQDPGDVTNISTSVLEKQLYQQQVKPFKTVGWRASFKKKRNSMAAVSSMLGTVAPEIQLGQPLYTLKPSIFKGVSGLVVVNDCVCATGWLEPYVYICNRATNAVRQFTLKGLQAVGMAAIQADGTLVIADRNRKLHFLTFNQCGIKITRHVVQNITFEPFHISIHPVTGQLVIVDDTKKDLVLCDAEGKAQKRVKVKSHIGCMCCALVTSEHTYVVLDRDEHRLHWVDSENGVTQTYDHRDGEGLSHPCHMVTDSEGRLVVADNGNHRVHLIDASGDFLCYLLTRDDGIQHPDCVCLDETASLLYVTHWPNEDSHPLEIRVYRWPKEQGLQVSVGGFH